MKGFENKHLIIHAISLSIAVLVSGLFLSGSLERLELLTVNLRHRLPTGAAPDETPPVAVVVIDQNSIKKFGRWPIERRHYKSVLGNVYRDGAKGVLMDLDFSSSGPDPGQDEELVRSIRDARSVVLAAQMEERVTREGALLRNVSLPLPDLMEAAMALGSITFEVSPDGVVHRMPPDIDFVDARYSPLGAVGASMLDAGAPTEIPAGALINFTALIEPSFPIVPFRKAADGDFPKGSFSDRIVLIGATSPDLHDFWLTPMGLTPGVFIQVAVLDTVLNRSWLLRQGVLSTLAGITFLGLFAGMVTASRTWKGGALLLLLLLIGVGTMSLAAVRLGYLIQTVPLLLVCALTYPVQIAVRARGIDISLERERQKTEAFLSIADLRTAEDEGQESQFVPLVLIAKILKLQLIRVYTWNKHPDGRAEVRRIHGEGETEPDPQLLEEVRAKGICLAEKRRGGGTLVLVPLATVRRTLGVLFAESGKNLEAGDEDVRLLLAFATQTAYYLESLALDLRVKDLYINTIRAISRALDSKDHYTSAHSELSLDHVERFGRLCGLDREQIEALQAGALLHDIGKIGVPDSILTKSSPLSAEEYAVISKHPVIGFDIVGSLPFPEDVKMIIKHHHECYDGSGYPDGLKGYEIPLLVRIFTILDVYEALVGYRPYRKAVDTRRAAEILREGAGTQFDPDLLNIFIHQLLFAPEEHDGHFHSL